MKNFGQNCELWVSKVFSLFVCLFFKINFVEGPECKVAEPRVVGRRLAGQIILLFFKSQMQDLVVGGLTMGPQNGPSHFSREITPDLSDLFGQSQQLLT